MFLTPNTLTSAVEKCNDINKQIFEKVDCLSTKRQNAWKKGRGVPTLHSPSPGALAPSESGDGLWLWKS